MVIFEDQDVFRPHNRAFGFVADDILDLHLGVARHQDRLFGREVGQPAGELVPLLIIDVQHVTFGEFALDRHQIITLQAALLGGDRADSLVRDDQRSGNLQTVA